MHRITSYLLFLVTLLLTGTLWAQDSSTNTSTATCYFDDERQLVVQYQPVVLNLKKPVSVQVPFGKVWAPGGKAMTLFTNTQIQVGSRVLPIGAYTMFVIPSPKRWTLVVSKSTDVSGAYNEQQDLVRVSMDSGELPNPEPSLAVSFGHISANQCNLRFDLDKMGHFAGFELAQAAAK